MRGNRIFRRHPSEMSRRHSKKKIRTRLRFAFEDVIALPKSFACMLGARIASVFPPRAAHTNVVDLQYVG